MTVVSFSASNNVSALKLRPLSFGKSPLSWAVFILNSGIHTTFLHFAISLGEATYQPFVANYLSITYRSPMYIGHLSPCQVLSAEGGAVAVTKFRRRRSATHCRRSFHHHPRPIGRVKIYRETRFLSTGQIVAGKFRPKKSVAVKGTRNFVNLPILLAVAKLNFDRRTNNPFP